MSRAEPPPPRCLRPSGLPINCYSHQCVRDWGAGEGAETEGRCRWGPVRAGPKARSCKAPARTAAAARGGARACAVRLAGVCCGALWEL
jgi:hypothetical protein